MPSSTRRRSNRQRRGGTGGVYPADPNQSPEERIEFFLKHSTIKVLSHGSFGITFVATLTSKVSSPFRNMVAHRFGEEVRSLLLKFCMVLDFGGAQIQLANGDELSSVSPEAFQNEINAQVDIYRCSMHHLYPLCPAIVFADIVGSNEDTTLLDLINQKTHILEPLSARMASDPTTQYGVIVMEMANGYSTLYSQFQDAIGATDTTTYEEVDEKKLQVHFPQFFLLIAMLLRMARECGYTHGDFHEGNFMTKDFQMLDGTDVKVGQIIDFGFARKFTPKEQQEFNRLFDRKKYGQAAEFLCSMARADDYVMGDSGSYTSVCHATQLVGYSDAVIQHELDLMKEIQEKRNPEALNYIRSAEPATPALPLPKQFTDQLFQGFNKPLPSAQRSTLFPPSVLLAPEIAAAFEEVARDTLAKVGRNKAVATLQALFSTLRFIPSYDFSNPGTITHVIQFFLKIFLYCEGVLPSLSPQAKQYADNALMCTLTKPRTFLTFLDASGQKAVNAMNGDQLVALLLEDEGYFDPSAVAARLNSMSSSSTRKRQLNEDGFTTGEEDSPVYPQKRASTRRLGGSQKGGRRGKGRRTVRGKSQKGQ